MLRAMIMAGGSGTRFWPLSRQHLPKQFLRLFGERSLLQQSYDRIADLVGENGVLVVTNQKQVAKTREQLPELPADHVVGEPAGRDTAPCIGLAAAVLATANPHARMIVLAADHLIHSVEQFHAAVTAADEFIQKHPQTLVTFGIRPNRPSTGYGYVRRGALLTEDKGVRIHAVQSFHEKPDLATAEQFLASGDYLWNSGIFCWTAETILEELKKAAPELHAAVWRIAEAWNTPKREAVFAREFEPLKKVSIDYAVMEKAKHVAMVEAPFQWDDVGSWLALERVLEKDGQDNVVLGRHEGLSTRQCVVVGGDDHLVSTIGVENLIIVHTPDVTLVAHRNDEQSVKNLLAKLEQLGLSDLL